MAHLRIIRVRTSRSSATRSMSPVLRWCNTWRICDLTIHELADTLRHISPTDTSRSGTYHLLMSGTCHGLRIRSPRPARHPGSMDPVSWLVLGHGRPRDLDPLDLDPSGSGQVMTPAVLGISALEAMESSMIRRAVHTRICYSDAPLGHLRAARVRTSAHLRLGGWALHLTG